MNEAIKSQRQKIYNFIVGLKDDIDTLEELIAKLDDDVDNEIETLEGDVIILGDKIEELEEAKSE